MKVINVMDLRFFVAVLSVAVACSKPPPSVEAPEGAPTGQGARSNRNGSADETIQHPMLQALSADRVGDDFFSIVGPVNRESGPSQFRVTRTCGPAAVAAVRALDDDGWDCFFDAVCNDAECGNDPACASVVGKVSDEGLAVLILHLDTQGKIRSLAPEALEQLRQIIACGETQTLSPGS